MISAPGGRTDIVNAWSVFQFVMTSADPRPSFQRPDVSSLDFEKFAAVWDGLYDKGWFEIADKNLVVLEGRYTFFDSAGIRHVEFPPDIPYKIQIDCSVAQRKTMSKAGRAFCNLNMQHNAI